MGKLKIDGMMGLNGEYDADLSYLTGNELEEIKKRTGVRAGELPEAFAAGDYALMAAFAAIVLARAGHEQGYERIMAEPAGKVTIDFGEDEEEARPPGTPTTGGDENLPVVEPSTESDSEPSGETSSVSLAQPVSVLRATGTSG